MSGWHLKTRRLPCVTVQRFMRLVAGDAVSIMYLTLGLRVTTLRALFVFVTATTRHHIDQS